MPLMKRSGKQETDRQLVSGGSGPNPRAFAVRSLFGRFGSIWSESVANRFTREMQVNRRFKTLFPAYSAFGQELITVMTKINQKVSRFRLSWRW
jgi:hypothetical protein